MKQPEADRDPLQRVRQAILFARKRVYELHGPTPLDFLLLEGDVQLFLKREDLGPIHAYKWRGAYNKLASLNTDEKERGVVTASAGNHAQGIALAARVLQIPARIYMPVTTPLTKQEAVSFHGGDYADTILTGDDFGEASDAAYAEVEKTEACFVSAYDDWEVMGGQGTLADEIVMSGKGPFDVAYLQIGGGGMSASVAAWLKQYYPEIRIVGVEGSHQRSFQRSLEAGHPVRLPYVDLFSDGTAIPRIGDRCFPILRELMDDVVTVDNDELSAAIAVLWRKARFIAEPAGAMGVAGILRDIPKLYGKRVLAVCCGSNMDFAQLAAISRKAAVGSRRHHYLRVCISEEQGSLRHFLENYLAGFNITEFQYGKNHPEKAYYVIGFESGPAEYSAITAQLEEHGIPWQNVTGEEDIKFRTIPYNSSLWQNPMLARLEFNDRPGALLRILQIAAPLASLCYLNYSYSGERAGRALVGFQFESENKRNQFSKIMQAADESVLRKFVALDQAATGRILSDKF